MAQNPLWLPVFSTTNRDLLIAKAGMFIYNSTTLQTEFYDGASWKINIFGSANKVLNLGVDGLATGSAAPSVIRIANFYGYQFGINDDGFVRSFEIPYDADITKNVVFKIHWACNNTSAAKKIKWQIDFTAVAEGAENINAATTPLNTGDVAVSTIAYRLTESEIVMAAAYFAFDDVIGIQIKRVETVAGSGERPDNEPIIVCLELEYVSNKLGESI